MIDPHSFLEATRTPAPSNWTNPLSTLLTPKGYDRQTSVLISNLDSVNQFVALTHVEPP
jgi:hypothetical protein